jgi:hypothetical protein
MCEGFRHGRRDWGSQAGAWKPDETTKEWLRNKFGMCRDGVVASFNPQPGYPLAGGVGGQRGRLSIRLRLPASG